jgi:sugar phosphate isomerase/epimerase
VKNAKGGSKITEFILSTASLYNFDLRDVFRIAREAGFPGIELMITKNEDSQSTQLLLHLVEEYGLPVRAIHAPFLMATKKVWGDYLTKIDKSVAMARELGAGIVVVHLPYFWQWGYARWAYRNLNAYSSGCGVTVAMENAMLVNFYRTFNLSLFNSPRDIAHFENLVFDTSHYAIAGIDIFRAWEELGDRVRHIHLSNNYLKGFDDHALPYEGRLPLDRFLSMLRRDGFAGYISLELGPGPLEARIGEERILENLRNSLEYCIENYGS